MNTLPDKNIKCPATGFQKSCREIMVEGDCPKYVQIRGADPQTGEAVDRFGCVDSFLPMLLIEQSQQQRQTGAAIESFRNEMARANAATARMLSRGSLVLPAIGDGILSPANRE